MATKYEKGVAWKRFRWYSQYIFGNVTDNVTETDTGGIVVLGHPVWG